MTSHRAVRLALWLVVQLGGLATWLSLGSAAGLVDAPSPAGPPPTAASGESTGERLPMLAQASPRATGGAGAPRPPASPKRRKVRVSDPELARALSGAGGRLVGDYGTFRVLDVDEAVAAGLAGRENVEIRDDYDVVMLNTGPVNTAASPAAALRARTGSFAGKRLHLIHFAGPPQEAWLDSLRKTGVRVVTYIPTNAYLVYGEAPSLAGLQSLAATSRFVQWDGAYLSDYKIHPRARAPEGGKGAGGADSFAIQMVEDPGPNSATLGLINTLKLGPVLAVSRSLGYVNVVARLPARRLVDVARQPEVISIQPYAIPALLDERQDQIIAGNISGSAPSGPGYLAWLAEKGFAQPQFTASGFAVDLTDDGLDEGSTSPTHFGLYEGGDLSRPSRVAYARLEPPGLGDIRGCFGHGTLNGHIIAGFSDLTDFPHADAAGFRYGLGVAPFVRLGSSVIFAPAFTFPNYEDLQSRAYEDGARISSNSWGGAGDGLYTIDSQRYDALVRDAQPIPSAVALGGNQEMVIVFAAGNRGPGPRTVSAPGTAKNVITVGASENVRSDAIGAGGNSAIGNDGCLLSDAGADNLDDLIAFSGRGPSRDLRVKPDIVAPGTHVTGGVFQAASPGGMGTADACFNAESVCALQGRGAPGNPSNFFPLGQQFFTTSSGTSHSTPAVAGAAALVRQWFINQGMPPASPAMTKAVLMNSARYLTGAAADDTLPSNRQGMGLVDLGRVFDGTPRIFRDETDLFTATGQSFTWTGTISDASKPFRVSLAWTDAPGNTVGDAFNNDLDLTVIAGGTVYRGNVFSGPTSVAGGAADRRNNVESVFLPAGITGPFAVNVTAANINSDGVPGNASPFDQDFALVIYNAVGATQPVLAPQSTEISGGALTLVPDDCRDLHVVLKNWGGTTATGVVVTLATSTPGVEITQAVSAYPDVPPGGTAANVTPFSISTAANLVCGTTIALSAVVTTAQGGVVIPLALASGSPGPPATLDFESADVPKAIPDLSTIESAASVSGIDGAIDEVTVSLHLTHTFVGDLAIALVGPDGTTVELTSRNGFAGDDYGTSCGDPTVFDDASTTSITVGAAPFVGTFRPEEPLSAFAGKSGSAANGTWKLKVTDAAAEDIGTLLCWTVTITASSRVCSGGTGACHAPPPSLQTDLANISTRARVDVGDKIVIGGLIVEGTTPKTLLLRGRGPSLGGAPFFVPGTLADPVLRLFSGSSTIAENDNWQSVSSCTVACEAPADIARTGLDPCQPNPGQRTPPPGCSREAALLVTVPPGAYTFQLSGADGGSGVGLVEAIEVDDLGTARLVNISTRGVVQAGDNIMIGGFIVDGPAAKTVLLRGRGPSLGAAPFSLPGVLGDPLLRLFSGPAEIARNNDWQEPASCSPGFACGGAAQIASTGRDPCRPNPGQPGPPLGCQLESAILITLPPGAYTVQLSGAAGEQGIGLVEVFDVK